jgi:hypothetical protein
LLHLLEDTTATDGAIKTTGSLPDRTLIAFGEDDPIGSFQHGIAVCIIAPQLATHHMSSMATTVVRHVVLVEIWRTRHHNQSARWHCSVSTTCGIHQRLKGTPRAIPQAFQLG